MNKEGALRVRNSIFHYQMTVTEHASEFGIKRGRITMLLLTRCGETVYCYNRGLELSEADTDTKMAVRILLAGEDGR